MMNRKTIIELIIIVVFFDFIYFSFQITLLKISHKQKAPLIIS
ncbi:hypothetical protein OENI_80060 [Oenococcus oeni]|nr:hypothetical protein OENI_80060 [Oenococcus oeni]SYW11846.1 hypothetical protein OENI_140018 [Oenococcus oeni]SYW20946.1 hypothetical protein OENI_820017 [Oenococcus oeni]